MVLKQSFLNSGIYTVYDKTHTCKPVSVINNILNQFQYICQEFDVQGRSVLNHTSSHNTASVRDS